MLISCPTCAQNVSSNARTCPACGHPLRRSWLFGSFLAGPLGSLIRLAGFASILLSLIGFVSHGSSAGLFLILGIVLIVAGSYLRYASRHTVRIRD